MKTGRCARFGAFDNARQLRPKERRLPVRLKREEMDEFCRAPEALLERQFVQPKP